MGRASKLPEYSTASASLPRLITGEVKEGLTIDEFGSEQSEIIASFSFSYKEER